MTDPSMSDTVLIDRLAELGEQLERDIADAADDLADTVVAMIRAERADRSGPRELARRARRWSLAAAVALLVVALVALPGPRRTIARWFGVGSVRIDRVPTAPSPTAAEAGGSDAPVTPATPATTGTTGTTGVRVTDPGPDLLELGPRVGADEAVAATGLPLPVATSLGDPASFHIPGGRQIVARYEVDGRTVLVAVLAGSTDEPAFGKQVANGQVTPVDVPGTDGQSTRGLWISGEPHTFAVYYLDADGEPAEEQVRLAGDTLLWERDGTTQRVEGARDLAEALEIAGSMEP